MGTEEIGFGEYYLPLFCNYSRSKIESGTKRISFENFPFKVIKLYADWLHQISLENSNIVDIVQLLEFAEFLESKFLLEVSIL